MTEIGSRQFAAFIMKYCEYNVKSERCYCRASCGAALRADLDTSKLPSGWKLLGAGSYRWAFLAPDGFVYKVDKRDDQGSGNYAEAENIARIEANGRLPERVFFPKHSLHEFTNDRVVMVMELVETDNQFQFCGEPGDDCYCQRMNLSNIFREMLSNYLGCWTEWTDNLGSTIGLWDLHEDNVFPQSNGRVAIVDVGC